MIAYEAGAIAHPGFLARQANDVLSRPVWSALRTAIWQPRHDRA